MSQEVVDLVVAQLVQQALPAVLEEADHQVVVGRVRNVNADKQLALEEQLADGGRYHDPDQLQVAHLHQAPVDVTHG